MNKQTPLQWVAEDDLMRIDYDADLGVYRITVFQDGHYRNESWFDEEIFLHKEKQDGTAAV